MPRKRPEPRKGKEKPFTVGTFSIKRRVKGLTSEAVVGRGPSIEAHGVDYFVYKDRRKKKGTVNDRRKQ